MKTYTPDELRAVIDAHGLWMRGEGGQRAYLQEADLQGAMYKWAQVAFSDHGEYGRMLTAYIQTEGMDPVYQCGCFCGSLGDLKAYIENGQGRYKASRTIAMEYAAKLLYE